MVIALPARSRTKNWIVSDVGAARVGCGGGLRGLVSGWAIAVIASDTSGWGLALVSSWAAALNGMTALVGVGEGASGGRGVWRALLGVASDPASRYASAVMSSESSGWSRAAESSSKGTPRKCILVAVGGCGGSEALLGVAASREHVGGTGDGAIVVGCGQRWPKLVVG